MSGEGAEEFSGGPSDEGVGVTAWLMAQRLDGAREAHVEAARKKRTSRVLAALLALLSAPQGGEGR